MWEEMKNGAMMWRGDGAPSRAPSKEYTLLRNRPLIAVPKVPPCKLRTEEIIEEPGCKCKSKKITCARYGEVTQKQCAFCKENIV